MYLKALSIEAFQRSSRDFGRVMCDAYIFFAVQKSVYIHGADNIFSDHKVMELKDNNLIAKSDWNSAYKSSWQHIFEMILRRYVIFA